MAHFVGRFGTVEVSDDGGSNYYTVGGLTQGNYNHNQDVVDTTDFDSGGWKENILADSQFSLDFTANYDENDTGQGMLSTAFFAKTTLQWRVRPYVGSGFAQFVFQGNMSSPPQVSAPEGDKVEMSVTVDSTGTVVKSTQ